MARRTKNATSDKEKIKEGKSALRRVYYESVKSSAEEILKEAAEDYEDYDEAREWIYDQVSETVDGSEWVIYTAQNLDVMVASENWLAIEDQGLGQQWDDEQLTAFLAAASYWALHQDIMEEIERLQDEYFTEREGNPRRGSPDKNPKKKSRSKKKNPGRVPSKASLLR